MAKDFERRARRIAQALRAASRLPVDVAKLDMANTLFSPPEFYEDRPFICRDCGVEQIWTAAQQKWWYEEARGGVYTKAIRCRACRATERARIAEARAASDKPKR